MKKILRYLWCSVTRHDWDVEFVSAGWVHVRCERCGARNARMM